MSIRRRSHWSRRLLSVVICALMVAGPGLYGPAPVAQQRQRVVADEVTEPIAPISDPGAARTPREFRDHLITYLHETEATLTQAMRDPVIGAVLQARMAGSIFQLPIDPGIYATIDSLDDDQLLELQSALDRSNATLEAPAVLPWALAELNRHPTAVQITAGSAPGAAAFAGACASNYEEFDKILSKRQVTRALIKAQGPIALASHISGGIADTLNAIFEDIPPIGAKLVVILRVIWGVTNVTQAALGIAVSALDLQIAESELCLASCLSDSADAAHPNLDSGVWRGKGCDNRDNNCDTQGVIDEPAEDRFRPELFVDSSALLRCYASQAEADAAARRAVTALDDCKLAGPPSVSIVTQACSAMVTAQATDMGSPANSSLPKSFDLKVDGVAPVIGMPSLSSCYPTVAAARNALAATGVSDACSAFSKDVRVTEKECVANLTLEAIDECGNSSSTTNTVRVDGSSPEVQIETLKIPSINGLSCFSSEAGAVATVAAATKYSDSCATKNDLTFATTTSGNACNLTVTSTVSDQCVGVTTTPSSESLLVRVDTLAPVISCTVAKKTLWPANEAMVDVGFILNLGDNCDPQPAIDVTVTSDEATRYAYVTQNGNDPYPDAVVERTPTGGIQRILLRAQRRTSGTSNSDGRVYRIRVVATDACGLSSSTECWVEVPATSNSTAVNTGQNYDASTEN